MTQVSSCGNCVSPIVFTKWMPPDTIQNRGKSPLSRSRVMYPYTLPLTLGVLTF